MLPRGLGNCLAIFLLRHDKIHTNHVPDISADPLSLTQERYPTRAGILNSMEFDT